MRYRLLGEDSNVLWRKWKRWSGLRGRMLLLLLLWEEERWQARKRGLDFIAQPSAAASSPAQPSASEPKSAAADGTTLQIHCWS